MTRGQAYKILDIDRDADRAEIKKKYRQLMHLVHPDAGGAGDKDYAYTAQEINEAYAILCKSGKRAAESKRRSGAKAGQKSKAAWDAPLNEHAYTEREVYHYVEDCEGEIIGTFTAATGKYIWTLQEDFPLFLKSMFACSKRLLDAADRQRKRTFLVKEREKMQPELAYLLAQQFIDAPGTLRELVTLEENDKANVFYIASMLELAEDAPYVRAGMSLYPLTIKKHRLFLGTKSGQRAGYLSFRDDRLYYIVIPLLEQKRAQVKITVSSRQDRLATRGANRYKNIDFWVRVPHDGAGTFPESINLQIEQLLGDYLNLM